MTKRSAEACSLPPSRVRHLPMRTLTLLAAALLPQIGSVAAQQEPTTKRVAFAQHCFWTGEMKLGQIEGVMRTEAGYVGGREVTLVEYAPDKLSLENLVRRAKQAGLADSIHLDRESQTPIAGVAGGKSLAYSYQVAPADDQKKQIQGTPFSRRHKRPK